MNAAVSAYNHITVDRIFELSIAGCALFGGYLSATGIDLKSKMEGVAFAVAASSLVCFAWALTHAAKGNYSRAAKGLVMAGALGYIHQGYYKQPVFIAEKKEQSDSVDAASKIYRNNLKNREIDKEAPQIFCPRRGAVLIDTDRALDKKSAAQPTPSKTDSSSCFGIKPDSECGNPYERVRSLVKQIRFAPEDAPAKKIIIKSADGKSNVVDITKILGSGGCKRALEISENRALMIPNTDVEHPDGIASYWPRIVDEECAESHHRRELGLVSLPLERVEFTYKEDCPSIPAYVTKTFEELEKRQEWSVIDTKNDKSTVYRKIFADDEQRMNPENWDNIVRPLVKDIENLIRHNFLTFDDSVNLVVIRENNLNPSIRILGFDFTSKYSPLTVPSKRNYQPNRVCANNVDEARKLVYKTLKNLLPYVIELELGLDWLQALRDGRPRNLAEKICERFKDSFFDPC